MPKGKGFYERFKFRGDYMYRCLACGSEWPYAKSAEKCCADLKPVSSDYILHLGDDVEKSCEPPVPEHLPMPRRPKQPRYRHRDQYGHRYRGHNPDQRLEAHYHQAQELIADYYLKQECKKLESLWGDGWEWKHPPSNRQRMAFGFLTCHWATVRSAAEDMAM